MLIITMLCTGLFFNGVLHLKNTQIFSVVIFYNLQILDFYKKPKLMHKTPIFIFSQI